MLPLSVSAAAPTTKQIDSRIAKLQQRFKQGEYWNGYNDNGSMDRSGPTRCPHNGYSCGDCSCRCGEFRVDGTVYSGQCLGFVCKLAYEVFHNNPYSDDWTRIYGATDFKVGDIVRLRYVRYDGTLGNDHTYFIYKIEGDTVYVADCNVTGPCQINWQTTLTKAQLAARIKNPMKDGSTGFIWRYRYNNYDAEDYTRTHGVFSDVRKMSWYYDAVDYVYQNGIFKGTDAHTFDPESSITRAQFVQVLANLHGVKLTNSGKEPFTDVAQKAWYRPAVVWAYQNGIVQGVSKTAFAPNSPITREQLCVMLDRYAAYIKKPLPKGSLSFADNASISDWATTSVAACQRAGLVEGIGNGIFAPHQPATRAEAAKIFMVYHEKDLK